MTRAQNLPSMILIILNMVIVALTIKPIIRDFFYNKSELHLNSEARTDRLYFNIGKATKSMFFHELKARRY